MKILIISAHPDDLETGMGGTAKLLKDAGHEIVSVVGMLPDYTKRYEGCSEKLAKDIRKKESENAHSLLGIEPMFLNLLESAGILTHDHRREFSALMSGINPDVVFTHWPVDVNPDHRVLSALSLEVFLQKGVNTELFCYEVFSEIGRPQSLGFYPTHYADINSVVNTKIEIVFCHQSQGAKKLWWANQEMQENRGRECGCHNAEAFVRLTRFGRLDRELAGILKPTTWKFPLGMGIFVDPKAIGL